MDKKAKHIDSEEDFVNAFNQLFDSIPLPQSDEEIEEYLIDSGIDTISFSEKIHKLTQTALKESPLSWRSSSAKQAMLNARKELENIKKESGISREDILTQVHSIIEKLSIAKPQLATTFYRNYDEIATDDLISYLQELELAAKKHGIIGD